ncbi:MAG TPA: dethiobiotin synthase [Burkholderiales bacterium]
MAAGFFITGTDTGVGKTLVACALLEGLRSSGRSVVGMKPVAAGREHGKWLDVDALAAASSVAAPERTVNPYAFEPAVAPHIAAQRAGIQMDLEKILAAFRELSRLAEVVIVEGAGGFLVPLNARQTTADLARLLGVPVVLVVGMRLGCLNHALLTRDAIASAGLPCAGWVANGVVEEMPELEYNVQALVERLDCDFLGEIPYRAGLSPRDAARSLNVQALLHAHG